MKALEIGAATGSVGQYARDAREEPIIFTEDGQPIAAMVSIAGADLETLSLSTNPEFIALIERSRKRQGQRAASRATRCAAGWVWPESTAASRPSVELRCHRCR